MGKGEVSMARIAIVGVGAIGGAISGLLEIAGGHDVTLCRRRRWLVFVGNPLRKQDLGRLRMPHLRH
jgi:ketopantoate reductase